MNAMTSSAAALVPESLPENAAEGSAVLAGVNLPYACRTGYQLPGNPSEDVYIIPVSGGADSSYLAILMHEMFPDVHFRMPFTDTDAEDAEIYTCLDRLETFIGRKIERLSGVRGLFGWIDHWGGLLPSADKRWCTPTMKLAPMEDWLAQFKGRRVYMFIGVRADEASRLAFTIDGVSTEMPYIDMGVKRADVFAGMSRTIGIPLFYRRRVRSGCANCFFQRRSEVVGLMQEQPVAFIRGKSYEKVKQSDLDRHTMAPSLSAETKISRNWLSLPLPDDGSTIVGSVARNARDDLFGQSGIFVAAEFMFDGGYGFGEFIWAQRVVSYSPTLHGIKRQVADRYAHLLSTAEVHEMTPDDVRHKVRFALYYIEAPSTMFDPRKPSQESYTWSQGTSYAQIEHIVSWAERVLHAEQLQREAAVVEHLSPLSWAYENAACSKDGLQMIEKPVGHLVNAAWFKPEEPKDEFEEEDIRFVRCAGCQI